MIHHSASVDLWGKLRVATSSASSHRNGFAGEGVVFEVGRMKKGRWIWKPELARLAERKAERFG